jgi:hypothetical protein
MESALNMIVASLGRTPRGTKQDLSSTNARSQLRKQP